MTCLEVAGLNAILSIEWFRGYIRRPSRRLFLAQADLPSVSCVCFPAPFAGLYRVWFSHPGFRSAPPMGYDPARFAAEGLQADTISPSEESSFRGNMDHCLFVRSRFIQSEFRRRWAPARAPAFREHFE